MAAPSGNFWYLQTGMDSREEIISSSVWITTNRGRSLEVFTGNRYVENGFGILFGHQQAENILIDSRNKLEWLYHMSIAKFRGFRCKYLG